VTFSLRFGVSSVLQRSS